MRLLVLEGSSYLEVKGESYYQAGLARLAQHTDRGATEVVAALRREPDNPHDEFAIAVYVVGPDGDYIQGGYLTRGDARRMSQRVQEMNDSGIEVGLRGHIVGGRGRDPYGLELLIDPDMFT